MGVEKRAAVGHEGSGKLGKSGRRWGSGSGSGSASASAPAVAAPPPPRRWISSGSVTRREIERFWKKRRSVEEEHFLAAIKAAARLRASRLSEEDYLVFLEENKMEDEAGHDATASRNNKPNTENKAQEIHVGIKDWWTKSKYAYLNEPAAGSTGGRLGRGSRRWNYVPNKLWLCNYKYAAAVPAKDEAQPLPLPPPPPPYLRVF